MKHTVKLAGVIVGHSELENAEQGTGRAWGAFRPGLGYELVQPVFRLFAQGELERYYNARDALKLELVDGSGRAIPTSAIHIVDRTEEEGPSALTLDVLIPDESYWRRRAGDR